MAYPHFQGLVPPHQVDQPMHDPLINGIAVYTDATALGRSGSAKTISFVDGHFQRLVVDDDCTISFADVPDYGGAAPHTQFTMRLFCTAVGHPHIIWPNTARFPDGVPPDLTGGPADEDIFEIRWAAGLWWIQSAGANMHTSGI